MQSSLRTFDLTRKQAGQLNAPSDRITEWAAVAVLATTASCCSCVRTSRSGKKSATLQNYTAAAVRRRSSKPGLGSAVAAAATPSGKQAASNLRRGTPTTDSLYSSGTKKARQSTHTTTNANADFAHWTVQSAAGFLRRYNTGRPAPLYSVGNLQVKAGVYAVWRHWRAIHQSYNYAQRLWPSEHRLVLIFYPALVEGWVYMGNCGLLTRNPNKMGSSPGRAIIFAT